MLCTLYYLTMNICFLKDSAGVCHLKKLSDAGITHIHLLPTFQFGDVADEKEKWKSAGKHISYFVWAVCFLVF